MTVPVDGSGGPPAGGPHRGACRRPGRLTVHWNLF